MPLIIAEPADLLKSVGCHSALNFVFCLKLMEPTPSPKKQILFRGYIHENRIPLRASVQVESENTIHR